VALFEPGRRNSAVLELDLGAHYIRIVTVGSI